MTQEDTNKGGLTRRDALKRGAAIGAVAWIAPTVTAAPAFADGSGGGGQDPCTQAAWFKVDTPQFTWTGTVPDPPKPGEPSSPDHCRLKFNWTGPLPLYYKWAPDDPDDAPSGASWTPIDGATFMIEKKSSNPDCYLVTLPDDWYFLKASIKGGNEPCREVAAEDIVGEQSYLFCDASFSNLQAVVCVPAGVKLDGPFVPEPLA